MPRTRKAAPPPPVVEDDDFIEVPVEDLPPDVENVIRQIGDDVTTVVLFKRGKGDTKQAYVGSLAADEFSMDDVARRWGGGRYTARLTGKGGIIRGMNFVIDESIKPETDTPASRGRERDDGNGVTAMLLTKMMESMNRPQRDPMEIAAQMAQASASQSQAMVAAITAAMAPLLAKITELSAGNRGSGMTPESMLELIEFGAERFGGEGASMLPVVRDVGIPLVQAIEKLSGTGRVPARPAANPPTVEGTPVTPQQPNVPPWVTVISAYVPTIIKFAQRQDDPGMWAAVLEAQQPKFATWLDELLTTDPTVTDQLFTHFPQLVAHREWVTDFLDHFGPEGGSDEVPPQVEVVEEKETEEE